MKMIDNDFYSMSKEDICKFTAERIMRWQHVFSQKNTHVDHAWEWRGFGFKLEGSIPFEDWKPTEDLNQAKQVVDKICTMDFILDHRIATSMGGDIRMALDANLLIRTSCSTYAKFENEKESKRKEAERIEAEKSRKKNIIKMITFDILVFSFTDFKGNDGWVSQCVQFNLSSNGDDENDAISGMKKMIIKSLVNAIEEEKSIDRVFSSYVDHYMMKKMASARRIETDVFPEKSITSLGYDVRFNVLLGEKNEPEKK